MTSTYWYKSEAVLEDFCYLSALKEHYFQMHTLGAHGICHMERVITLSIKDTSLL